MPRKHTRARSAVRRTHTSNQPRNNPTQRCAVTHQPQREAVHQRTRDDTPHKHARTDTHDATSPTHHNGTSASWRVSPKTAHANKPRTAHRTLTHSIQHTSPARTHDIPHSRNHCALRKHHCTHTAAHTPHKARHTAPSAPHTAHRKSHPVTHAASTPHSLQSCQAAQRRRDAAGELVAEQVQRPAGHTNSHRVTPWHPTLPTPASRPQRIASQRSAAHCIASIKQSAPSMLSLTHSTVRE
jgi:hypothetical protein